MGVGRIIAGGLWFLAACTSGSHTPVTEGSTGDLLGRAWVSDVSDGAVWRVDLATGGAVRWLDGAAVPAEAGAFGVAPSGLAWWGDRLVVTNFRSGEVLAFDADDASLTDVLYTRDDPGPRLEEPVAVAWVGPELALLGNDTANVVMLEPRDVRSAQNLSELPVRLGHDLLADGDTLLVATSPSVWGQELVQRYDVATGELLDAFAPYPEVETATGLAEGPDGLLYVVDGLRGEVVRYTPDGDWVDVWRSGLHGPVSLRFVGPVPLLLTADGLFRVNDDALVPLLSGLAQGRSFVVR